MSTKLATCIFGHYFDGNGIHCHGGRLALLIDDANRNLTWKKMIHAVKDALILALFDWL